MGGLFLTSSPSMKGRFIVLAMNWPTVLFPQPAGPVTIKRWWLELVVPVEVALDRRGAAVAGVGCTIAGRFSWDSMARWNWVRGEQERERQEGNGPRSEVKR